MKSKSQIPGWAILVAALAVALLAAVTIATLHQQANESRHAELLLYRLKEQSYHLDSLEWQFWRIPDSKVLEEVQQVEGQIAQTFDELMLLDPGEERLQQLHKTQLEFQNNMDEMFRLIAAEDLEKADILDKERVDPSFNALSDMITNTSAIYSERANQAQRKAGIGTTLVVIAAGMMVGSLILRFQKMQLRAKLTAVEQKVLRQSEERYRTIIETAHDLIWTLNNEGNFTFFNRRSEETSGYKISEWIGKSFAPLIFPEDLPKIQEVFLKTLQGNPQSYDVRVYKKDGKIFILSVNTVPLYENDKIIGTVSFGRDITEHKQVEEALQQSEEKYRTLIDNIQDGVFLTQGTKIQFANEAAAKMVGYTAEEIIGKDFRELVAPEDLDMVMDYYRRRHAGEDVPREYEFCGVHRDGTRKTFNMNNGLINYNGRVAIIGTVKDITERRRAEEKLRLFRNLIDQSSDAIFVDDPETGRILDANDKACTSLGYKLEELLSMHVFDFETVLLDHFSWKEHVQEVKKKGYLIFEGRQRRKDGTIFPVEVNISYVSLEKNNYMLTVARDITERKRAEEELRKSEERFRQISESAGEWIWEVDADGLYTYSSPVIEKILGYKPQEIIGKKHFYDFFVPDVREELKKAAFENFARKESFRGFVNPNVHTNGNIVILDTSGLPILDGMGNILGYRGTDTDITERRRTEENLRLFRNLIDQSNDAIFVGDPETGRILDANDKACTSLGYKLEELLSMHVFDFETALPDHFSWKEHVQEVKKKGYLIFEGRQRRKDGAIFPVEVNISYVSLEKNNYMLTVARDITERKRMENALRESEDIYRTVFKTTGTAMGIVEEDTKISLVNEEFEKLTGYPREEMEGKKSWTEFVVKEDLERMIKHHRERRVDPKLAPNKYEFRSIDRNGSIKDIFLIIAMIPGTKKSIVSLMDITEHKRSEEQVKEQAALLDKAQDAILVRNLEDCITYWNKSAQRLYGWTAQEAIGKNASELLYKDIEDSSRHIEARKSVVERGEWNGELYHVTKDGREVIVESRWTLMHDNKGKPKSILAINTDITGKKKLEEQFLRAQRMESVGTLAGGIAHDINNVLTPIMLSLELLKEKFTDNKSQQLIDILDRSAKRGASLMKQVQSFARGVEGERIPLQTAHLISEIRQIAKETFPRNIEIRTDIPKDLWTISGDATQLHQVLMNLCVNGRDAMPDGGILSISARNIFIDEDFTHINIEARVGRYIVIAVTDTGAGIPPKIMDRMFEPFFTTKEHGKGTGLGLSTALGIVKSHGGFINVYSEVRKGTTFKVYLPAITTTETQKAQEPMRERVRGYGELILIIDDEAQIRDITSSVLQTNGYRVLTANNGLEAIALYEQNREEIKIVLMDMMMPVMDGLASIQELRKINPQLKIIVASGLTEKDKLTKAAGTVNAFLPKPYTAEKLLRTVHEVLSAE